MANISMDKKYKTRDGKSVRILCVDAKGDWPIVGLVETQEGEYVTTWRANDLYGNTRSGDDLVEATPYADFYSGQPVMVALDTEDRNLLKRYFSHEANGTAYCFTNGTTAWTYGGTTDWPYCRALTAEEQAKYDALIPKNTAP